MILKKKDSSITKTNSKADLKHSICSNNTNVLKTQLVELQKKKDLIASNIKQLKIQLLEDHKKFVPTEDANRICVSKSTDTDTDTLCSTIIKSHIENLKTLNEFKDLALRLVIIIAAEKNCTTKEVFQEMGFSDLF
ncbi:Sae3p SCDLUD_004725 [Saccharomycodes ludwigii]|uniref:Sae3p n=1 Tax=Saccharomycodes ludwigii TaxID=36035 RepID=UPI001E8233EE|nr:hypothetical protein SCDLUD_004725 [Saccharomycodes ludwigii]KAH3899288.1 hypothetical protein SCDLUD_004725 [Saccharomycodes ludwigii]